MFNTETGKSERVVRRRNRKTGTQLEILTVVQLLQVEHMVDKPLILVGPMWKKIMHLTAAHLHANGYISDAEKVFWRYASTPEEAARMLL